MSERKTSTGRLAGLATVTALVVVLAGCSASPTTGAAVNGTLSNALKSRLEREPYQAGSRVPGPTVKLTRATIQMGRTGIHPGGGGPQK